MSISEMFRVSGRATRLDYWRMQLRILVVSAALVFGAVFLTMAGLPRWIPALVVLPLIGVVWISIAVVVRRLHDRNKAGWWIILFQLGPWLLTAIPAWLMIGLAHSETPTVMAVITASALASVILSLWALVEIGFLRGTAGANRFGPPS